MTMTIFQCLIPIVTDADVAGARRPHPQDVIDQWESSMARQFGGFSRLGQASGVWLDGKGLLILDESRVYTIGVESHREDELRDFIGAACALFSQRCIFLQKVGTAEMVYPKK